MGYSWHSLSLFIYLTGNMLCSHGLMLKDKSGGASGSSEGQGLYTLVKVVATSRRIRSLQGGEGQQFCFSS